jgi:hypothetical protein
VPYFLIQENVTYNIDLKQGRMMIYTHSRKMWGKQHNPELGPKVSTWEVTQRTNGGTRTVRATGGGYLKYSVSDQIVLAAG